MSPQAILRQCQLRQQPSTLGFVFGEIQCSDEMVFGILVGKVLQRTLPGQPVVAQGFGIVSTLTVVIGKRFVVLRLHFCVGLSYTFVQFSKPKPMRVLSNRLRHQRMDEFIQGVCTTFLDHLRPVGELDCIDHVVFALLAGLDQDFIVKLSTQDRCHSKDFLYILWQFGQARLNCDLDPLRNLEFLHAGPVPFPVLKIEFAALHQRSADFLDKERIAVRFPVDAIQEFRGDFIVEDRC